jgi:nitrile hydratase
MDGMHDLGGRQGFGRVRYTLKAQTFHEPLGEARQRAVLLAVRLGIFNMDEYRHAIERMEPRHYLPASYYERSLTSLARSASRKASFTKESSSARRQARSRSRCRSAPAAATWPTREASSRRRCACAPTSSRARAHAGYIRGKTGVVVERVAGLSVPRRARPWRRRRGRADLRRSRFNAEELWPNSADKAQVHVGVFESYLDRAN